MTEFGYGFLLGGGLTAASGAMLFVIWFYDQKVERERRERIANDPMRFEELRHGR